MSEQNKTVTTEIPDEDVRMPAREGNMGIKANGPRTSELSTTPVKSEYCEKCGEIIRLTQLDTVKHFFCACKKATPKKVDAQELLGFLDDCHGTLLFNDENAMADRCEEVMQMIRKGI
jgi:hypothetical protein